VSVRTLAQIVWWASAAVGALAFWDTLTLTAGGRRNRWVERRDGVRLFLALIEGGAVLLYLLLGPGRWPLFRAPGPANTAAIVGALLAAAGALFAVWAKRTLGRHFSVRFGVKEGHALVTSGPYAVVRHPIYTGLLTFGAGSALVWNDAALVGVAAVIAACFAAHVRVEEELFVRHFGDAYRAYQRTTPALVPRLFGRRRQG
jgi:protein-S-isoprenylcysteine O-methyltransferase Ste14